jgi:diguanylate cyclase (GGDEF)-like protein
VKPRDEPAPARACGAAADPREPHLGSLVDASRPLCVVSPDDRLKDVITQFRRHPRAIGLVFEVDGEPIACVSRETLHHHMARAHVMDLYGRQPARKLLIEQIGVHLLLLPHDTPIGLAVDRSLGRPTESRYDPIVVQTPDGRRHLVELRALMVQQRHQLQAALRQVDRERGDAQRASRTDPLTGLTNRAAALQLLDRALTDRRAGEHVGVLFLDFDHFKQINDSLGHAAGDELLVQIAGRLSELVGSPLGRPGHRVAARLGGDEFLLLLPGLTSLAESVEFAARVLAAMGETFEVAGVPVRSTPSIGIASTEHSEPTADHLMRDADEAMYEAKRSGRARVVPFNRMMRAQHQTRRRLAADLADGLAHDRYEPHFQALIDSESGRIVGFEALARWTRSDGRVVEADAFIGIALEIGLLPQIEQRIIQKVITQVRQWQADGLWQPTHRLSLNISRPSLLRPQMADHLAHSVKTAELQPGSFIIELPQIDDGRTGFNTVANQLHEAGFGLAIDDFGVGASSLTALQDLPITHVKLDRELIDRLADGRDFVALVQSIVELAHNLGIRVIAEGVQHADQLAQVQALECDTAQGYLFGLPADADAATRLLRVPQPFGHTVRAA